MIASSPSSRPVLASPHQKPLAPKQQQPQQSQSPPDSVSSSTHHPIGGGGAAPCPQPLGTLNGIRGGGGGCRRKIAFHPTLGYAIAPPQPAKVARRNARERNRVKQVNNGFEMLREHIPGCEQDKKMSKVDTLRHAVEYIRNLQKMLTEQQKGAVAALVKVEKKEEDTADSKYSPPPQHQQQHQQQQPHLQQPHQPAQHFQYPSPLTPRTPTSAAPPASEGPGASANFYTFSNSTAAAGNESGYETSSYYSHSPGLVSPSSHHGHHHGHHPHHQAFAPPPPALVAPPPRPDSSSSSSASPTSAYTPNFFYSSTATAASDDAAAAQEEELLDAIASWQDQED